ncbi:MAG: hypothetical protein M0D57_06745 [Sphingobacteriales bacterium JAD_PAG50586_3]|nr:MAG: hypothetical protein M0D57_06745 [Sphingobacteriales bacterium JAD_PAG50586_3]
MDKKLIVLLFVLIQGIAANAQDDNTFVKKHILRTQGNLSLGYMVKQKTVPAYIGGDFDFFFDEKVSFYGEGSFFVTNTSDEASVGYKIKHNHAILSGINIHFTKQKRFDPYIGINPGIMLSQFGPMGDINIGLYNPPFTQNTKLGVSPVFSTAVGANYYVGSIFNFFVRVRYIQGQFFGTSMERIPLSEFRFSAGLGWNWNFIQKAVAKRK